MSAPPSPHPKPLVLCADDYALRAGVTRGILALLAQGRLSATSAMVLSPRWAEDARRLRDGRHGADVGLHLDMTSPFAIAAGHGRPLGALMRQALLGGVPRVQARTIVARQLDAFEAHWQAPPDFIDGHQHVQQFPGLRDALVEAIGRRYPRRKPWLRISRTPPAQQSIKSRVIAALGAGLLENRAMAAGIPHAHWLSGVYNFDGDLPAYARRMRRWLAQAPAATVLMCHPADGPVETGEDDDEIATARGQEFDFLRSPAFAEQLAATGVSLATGRHCFAPPAA